MDLFKERFRDESDASCLINFSAITGRRVVHFITLFKPIDYLRPESPHSTNQIRNCCRVLSPSLSNEELVPSSYSLLCFYIDSLGLAFSQGGTGNSLLMAVAAGPGDTAVMGGYVSYNFYIMNVDSDGNMLWDWTVREG